MLAFDVLGGVSVIKGFLPGALIAFVGFIVFFAYGVGGTGWLIQAEYFDARVRGRMVTIGALIDWVANFAIMEVFPVMLSTVGLSGSMFIFAALDVVAMAFVYLLVPKTKGLSLKEVVRMFSAVPFSKLRRGRELVAQFDKQAGLEGGRLLKN